MEPWTHTYGFSLRLHRNKCAEIPYPSSANSTRALTCGGLCRLALAVFMDTPGSCRLFLIKDIKQGELPEPQNTCFLTLPRHVFAAVFKELGEDEDTTLATLAFYLLYMLDIKAQSCYQSALFEIPVACCCHVLRNLS